MKSMHSFILSATRILAAAGLLIVSFTAQSETVLTLKGQTLQSKYDDDSEVRVSIIDWSEETARQTVAEKLQQYLAGGDLGQFESALKEQQTRGYIFTEEATGYTIKYAWQEPLDGGNRTVLVVTPALKTLNPYYWSSPNNSHEKFSVVELREGAHGNVQMKVAQGKDATFAAVQGGVFLEHFDKLDLFANLQDNRPYYLKSET